MNPSTNVVVLGGFTPRLLNITRPHGNTHHIDDESIINHTCPLTNLFICSCVSGGSAQSVHLALCLHHPLTKSLTALAQPQPPANHIRSSLVLSAPPHPTRPPASIVPPSQNSPVSLTYSTQEEHFMIMYPHLIIIYFHAVLFILTL